jgi:hypothetical protein
VTSAVAVVRGTLSAALLTLPRGYHSAMAREGDRRGPGAPRRSPQELAETLATLAATTPEPPPRPRRRGPRAVLEQDVTLTPEPEVEPETRDEPTPPPAPVADTPAPAPDPPAPAVDPISAPQRSPRTLSLPDEVSNRAPARTRRRSRSGGRVWRRRQPSRTAGGLRTGRWRRSRTPRPASDRANRGPRNVRRLYPPLLVVLLIVVVVALVNHGGGGSSKTSEQSVSAPSAFPTPSTVPTTTPPPVPAPVPTPTVQQQPVATQPKSCPPLRVAGHAVSVNIVQGQVTCQSARAVVRAFKSGQGRHRGQYVTVRGWRCVPTGTCTRPGKSIKAS